MLTWARQYFTTPKSISFNYKWTIENYDLLNAEGHPWKWRICSGRFSQPNNQLFEFELYLYPKCVSGTGKDFVSVGVGVADMPQEYNGKIKCQWNVSIEDEKGDRCGTKNSGVYCLFDSEEKTIPNCIEYSSLLNSSTNLLPNDQLTLHFEADHHIFNVITNNEVGRSRFDCAKKVTRVMHTLIIENFTDLFCESTVAPFFIQSEYFPAQVDMQNEKFCLRLYPNLLSEERKDNLDIVIWNENENSATVHWRMSLLDVDGEECQTREGTGKIDSKNGKIFLYSRASLLDNSNGLVEDNKLRIYCEMNFMNDGKQETSNNTQFLDKSHKSESLFDVKQKTIHFLSNKWTIDQFSVLCLNNPKNDCIDSQIFNQSTDNRLAFHLRLWPNGHDEQSRDYLSLDLFNVSQHVNQVTVQYRMSLLDSNGQKLTGWFDQSSIAKNKKIRIPKFFHRFHFQNFSIVQNFLPNDQLTILCELWVIQDRKIYKSVAKPSDANSSCSSVQFSNVNIHGSIFNLNSTSNIDGSVDLKIDNSKKQ